jgi:acetyl esterase/lipase
MAAAWRWTVLVAAAALMSSCTLAGANAATADALPGATAHRELFYVFRARNGAAARQQSLDLFLPAGTRAGKLPLIAFVHGGFWRESDDNYGIGNALAQALVPHGVAVALIRYPLAPAHKFPVQPEDVARAFAYLHRAAGQYGFDAKRMFLMGHNAGAHLASLVALDGRYLRDAGAPAHAVAGVIAMSGIYDLGASGPIARRARELVAPVFGGDARTHVDASPVTHARGGPPFLVLSAENDFGGFQVDARRFAARLRAAGNRDVQEIVLQDFDHFSFFANLRGERSPMRDLVLAFAGAGGLDAPYTELMSARGKWQEPKLSTEAFRTNPELVRAYPVDERFMAAFGMIYDEKSRFELNSYPFREFHAIELSRFLDSQPRGKIGSGDYLVLTNVRGERTFWRLSEIKPFRPVVVIGLDDERNLFRMNTFYHNKRAYSWTEEKTELSVRSVGAFIYFLNPPPPRLNARTTAKYSLTIDSFKLSERDPLAMVADLPQDVHEVMYFRNACLSCHSFRGTGVRAGHLRARDGALQGGFALPLESYPPEVWRQFMFENHKSAAAIGVRPNPVAGPAAPRLFDIVVKERERSARPAAPR